MLRLSLAALLVLPVAAQPSRPSLADLAFLKGVWEAEPDATGAKGSFSVEEALGGKVLIRKNHLAFPGKDGQAGAFHEDLMVMASGEGALKADYWDNENHVIHYGVAVNPGEVVLTSAGPGPRFRLTYRVQSVDRLEITFEMAAPGTPDAFKMHLKGFAKRVAKGM